MIHKPGHHLIDEQQVQAIIHSLPLSWDQIKQNMKQNDNVRIFEDVSRHLELEAAKANGSTYVAETSSRGASGLKCKRANHFDGNKTGARSPKGAKATKCKRGK